MKMSISDIQIVDRHRKDLGNLDDLRESIADVGLLNPVTVTPTGRLVAGERRLAACSMLGWSSVEVCEVETLEEASAALRAEWDENVCRKDMLPSEKVSLGAELEKLERPKAAARKAATQAKPGEGAVGGENFSGPEKGEVGEKVGKAIGMSRPTYHRARHVVAEAEAGNPVAVEAVEEMDRTGKVTPAFERVTGRPTEGRKIAEGRAKTKPAKLDLSKERNRQVADKAKVRMETAVGMAAGISSGFPHLRPDRAFLVSTDEEIDGWTEVFDEAIATIRKLKKQMEALR